MPCLLGTCSPQPAPCASPANRGHILPSFLHILSFLRISGDPLPPWVQTPHPTGTPAPICASTPAPPVPIPVLGSQPAWASIPRLGLTPFPAACNVPPPLGGNPTMSGPPFPSAAHPTDWPGSMSVAHGPPAHQAPADSEPTCSSFSSGSSSQRAALVPPRARAPGPGGFLVAWCAALLGSNPGSGDLRQRMDLSGPGSHLRKGEQRAECWVCALIG